MQRILTIAEYNVENLFLSMEYYAGQDLSHLREEEWRALALGQLRRKQKPLRKVWGVAAAIEDIAPDVAMLVEVGGPESLSNFARHFLGGRYEPMFVESNSTRSIDLAFLVRKGLPYRAEIRSNRHLPVEVRAYLGAYTTRFSRDVAQLCLFEGDALKLILLLVHLKSRISTDEDLHGRDLREAEARALAALYEKIRRENPAVPVVVGGDFNAGFASPELAPLRATDLRSVQELRGATEDDRMTLYHFDHLGGRHAQDLDHLFVPEAFAGAVVPERSYTYRYRSFGVEEPRPETLAERYRLPSDHYPVVLGLRV